MYLVLLLSGSLIVSCLVFVSPNTVTLLLLTRKYGDKIVVLSRVIDILKLSSLTYLCALCIGILPRSHRIIACCFVPASTLLQVIGFQLII